MGKRIGVLHARIRKDVLSKSDRDRHIEHRARQAATLIRQEALWCYDKEEAKRLHGIAAFLEGEL